MSHVENSRLVEVSFGAESLFKLFNIFLYNCFYCNGLNLMSYIVPYR